MRLFALVGLLLCAGHAGLREGTHAEDCRKQKHPAPKQSDLRSEKG
jgi:hypothetical protein